MTAATLPRGAVDIDDVAPEQTLYLASVLFDNGNDPAAGFGPGHFFPRPRDAKAWLRVEIHRHDAPSLHPDTGQIAWWYGIVERVITTGDVTAQYDVDYEYEGATVYPSIPRSLRNAAKAKVR